MSSLYEVKINACGTSYEKIELMDSQFNSLFGCITHTVVVQPLTMTNSLMVVEDIHKCGFQSVTANNQLTINPKFR